MTSPVLLGLSRIILGFVIVISSLDLATCQTAKLDTSNKRFLKWMFVDWIDIAMSIDETDVLTTGLALGGIALTTTVDESVHSRINSFDSQLLDDYLNFANHFGGKKTLPIAAGSFLLSLPTGNQKLQDLTFTSTQSVIYSGVIWTSLKLAIGRERPEEGNGSHEWSIFNRDHNAMPSGHSGTAFALITPFVYYIDHPASKLLYVIPVSTTIARQRLDKHWLADTIAGGLIGYFVGRNLSRRHQSETQDRSSVDLGINIMDGIIVPRLSIRF